MKDNEIEKLNTNLWPQHNRFLKYYESASAYLNKIFTERRLNDLLKRMGCEDYRMPIKIRLMKH